jgi:hypothetical protein
MASSEQTCQVEQENADFFERTFEQRQLLPIVVFLKKSSMVMSFRPLCKAYVTTQSTQVPMPKLLFFSVQSLDGCTWSRLARAMYGPLILDISFEGQIGEDLETAEALFYTYTIDRIRVISYLGSMSPDFDVSEDSAELRFLAQ